MKYILLFLLLPIFSHAAVYPYVDQNYYPFAGTHYFISPTGDDTRSSTQAKSISTPWRTLTKAWTVLVAGDTLYCRGGDYPTNFQQQLSGRSGNASAYINIFNYPGEKPVFTWHGVTVGGQVRGILLNSTSYIHIKGLRVTEIAQVPGQGSYNYGFSLYNSASNCIVELCESDHIGGSGFHAGPNSHDNLFLNCDSHHNDDPYSPNGAHENSNGFEFSGVDMGANVVCRYCRAWWNGDDGFDTFKDPTMATFDGCWSFWNGFVPGGFSTAGNGQGFKIGQCEANLSGSQKRLYQFCVAYHNRNFGFDENFQSSTEALLATFYNCAAIGNGDVGFKLTINIPHVVKNCISIDHNGSSTINNGGGGTQAGYIGASAVQSKNSWQGATGVTVTDADFVSVNSAGIDGPRQADGSLPNINFIKLATGSDLIDKGVNVGLPFSGSAPDLGAFEVGSGVTNIPPVANAGSNVTITIPISSVMLNGGGSDADGTVASYNWTKVSGPSSYNISDPTNSSTLVTDLVSGTYEFQLETIDNEGSAGMDTVSVQVFGGVVGVVSLRGGGKIRFISQ